MSTPAPQPQKKSGWLKAGLLGVLGLGGGIAGTYATAVVNQVVKPAKPVANFSVAAEGLTVTCQNRASGESGWWDFGDGSALEPFANDSQVSHAYVKPGSYAVKLTVRNFLGEENERSVPVEVAAGAKEASAPSITGFAVQSVSPVSYAPATYRVTAEVTNADHCVWDFGDGRVEVAGGGKIDRMVTFDKPGAFPLVLVAHNDKQAVKQAAGVKVEAPPVGSVTAVLKVTDSGNQVMRHTRNESVAIPAPAGKGAQPTFTKTIHTRPGFMVADATLAKTAVAGVKNLKVAVATDKRSVIVSGEWAGDPKSAAKTAGGSDVIVPLKVTEERAIPVPPAVTMVTGTIGNYGGQARCDLPLPPPAPGLAGAKREYQIEIRQTGQDGKSVTTLRGPQTATGTLTFPWSGKVTGQGWSVVYAAVVEGDKVVVTAKQGL